MVSSQENDDLMRTFTVEELDAVLHETKTDTAPGPDGLPVLFYKKKLAFSQAGSHGNPEWVCSW
jgi:hypothetical protein